MTHSKRFNVISPTRAFSARTTAANMFILHGAATTSLEGLSNMIVAQTRQVSAHGGFKDAFGIGWVDEENRAWSLSDAYWDSRAFTLENANHQIPPYSFSGDTQESIAQWIADVSIRRGIWPHRDGDPKTWTVIGHREVWTIHKGSYATACPQMLDLDWITTRAQQIMRPKKKRRSTMLIVPLVAGNPPKLTGMHRVIGESGKTVDVPQATAEQLIRAQDRETMYPGSIDTFVLPVVKAIAPEPVKLTAEDLAQISAGIKVPGLSQADLTKIAALDDAEFKSVLAAIATVDEATLATFGLKRA